MESHFTATGFVVGGNRVLLLWHRKGQMWLPPGGHLLPGEDPVAAVLREIREETGLQAEVVAQNRPLAFAYPQQLPAPYTILMENSFEEGPSHQHIDFIYFCRPLEDNVPSARSNDNVIWVDEAALRADEPLELEGCGPSAGSPRSGVRSRTGQALAMPISPDVRALALKAIEEVKRGSVAADL